MHRICLLEVVTTITPLDNMQYYAYSLDIVAWLRNVSGVIGARTGSTMDTSQ